MKLTSRHFAACAVAVSGLGVYLSACGTDPAVNATTTTYAGPGSSWTAILGSDGTFNMTETDATPDMVINGTYTNLSSGFTRLTVSSASGTGAPVAGNTAYAINIPGVVLLVKPMGSDSQIIPMVAGGTCPSANQSLNWIEMDKDLTTVHTSDALGTFLYTHSSGIATLPSKFRLDGTSIGAGSVGALTCSGGIATPTGAKMYMTASGGAIVRPSDNSSTIMAMPSGTVTLAGLAGDYVGLVFASDDYPVQATVSGTGIVVQSVSAETGVVDGTINNTINGFTDNSPSAGFLSGSFNGASSEKVVCMAQTNVGSSGKNFIFCVGDDPNTGTHNIFNALFVSK